MNVASEQLVLASASPRRKQLLGQIGVRCRVVVSQVDETPLPGEQATDYAIRLASEKARSVAGHALLPVLGADTVVVKGGVLIGKPENKRSAVATLQLLQGGAHEVITACALCWQDEVHVAVSKSTVWFKALSVSECETYWRSGEPKGKAGSYAIQGLAAVFVEKIEGSFSGVMGLPLFETAGLLARVGIDVLSDYR